MTALSELNTVHNAAVAPVEETITDASGRTPSSEILGVAARLRSARISGGDRCFLFCPGSDTRCPGAFVEQVALGLLHLDGPSVLVVHLDRSQDDASAALAGVPHAVLRGSLTGGAHASLCLTYPMQGGNTAALLTPEFRKLMADARQQFNYVLVDSPPVQSNPAALLLAPESDLGIITIAAGRARQAQVQSACSDLQRCGAKLMGFVLITD